MAVKCSTGYATEIIGPRAFDQIFHNGVIEVYSDTQPASADDPRRRRVDTWHAEHYRSRWVGY